MKNILSVSLIALGLIACKEDSTIQPEEQAHVYPSEASHWQEGQVHFGHHEWTETIVGDIPIIISVPHGGNVRPEGVPDRGCPNVTSVRDMYTMELARAIEKEFVETYQKRPFIVINHLARIKVDQNREIEAATCGNETMKVAWHDYHNYTDTAVSTAATRFGKAIFIDLHGHGHANQRLEIGYSLNGNELLRVYSDTAVDGLSEQSSLHNILRRSSSFTLKELLMGPTAFGTLMAEQGIASVPSAQDPFPWADEPFFNGGYNTRFYTSSDYPDVWGWQIECNMTGVRDNAQNRAQFAKVFANVMMTYLDRVNF